LSSCFWACSKAEHHVTGKKLTSWWPWSRESNSKGSGTKFTIPGMFPLTYFLQKGPPLSFHHLLISPWNYASIIHKWINPLFRLEPSWSNHFPAVLLLNTVLGTNIIVLETWALGEHFIFKPWLPYMYAK
jgi:hypothetical protein